METPGGNLHFDFAFSNSLFGDARGHRGTSRDIGGFALPFAFTPFSLFRPHSIRLRIEPPTTRIDRSQH